MQDLQISTFIFYDNLTVCYKHLQLMMHYFWTKSVQLVFKISFQLIFVFERPFKPCHFQLWKNHTVKNIQIRKVWRLGKQLTFFSLYEFLSIAGDVRTSIVMLYDGIFP